VPDKSEATSVNESRDGTGSSDHDLPYEFGKRLSSAALSPFTFRQYAKLQILRGRIEQSDPPRSPAAKGTDQLVTTGSTPTS
jgi:hypothetical protein